MWRPETDTVIAFGGQDRLVYLEFAVWDKLAGLFSEPLAFTRPTTQILGSYAQSHLAFAWVLGIELRSSRLHKQAHKLSHCSEGAKIIKQFFSFEMLS